MSAPRQPTLIAPALTVFLSIGCAAAPTTIPLGEWAGHGVYVDSEITTGEELTDLLNSRSKSAVYETSLNISEQTLHGTDTLRFEIRSKRGKLFTLGDMTETHLLFNLVPIETLPTGATVYALAHASLDPEKDEGPDADEFSKQSRIPLAILTRPPGALSLQITYIPPQTPNDIVFEDTLVFESGRLRKTGRFLQAGHTKADDGTPQQKINQMYWTESLRRMK